jgi:hypothetical protein
MALRAAWDLLVAIEQGAEYVPRTAHFKPAVSTMHVAEPFCELLARTGKLEECVSIAGRAIAVMRKEVMGAHVLDNGDQRLSEACVRLSLFAAHCEAELGRAEAAEARIEESRAFSQEGQRFLGSVLALTALSIAAHRKGDTQRELELLLEAQPFAEQHRRSFPYELDKIRAAEETQWSSFWAGERLIEAGRSWEALAAFDSVRGRALLDMLGLSAGVRPKLGLPTEFLAEGERLLDAARGIAIPGSQDWAPGLRDLWRDRLAGLEEWLTRLAADDPDYVSIVRGQALDGAALRRWAEAVTAPTAVLHWFPGLSYSYQAILRAGGSKEPTVEFVRVPWSLDWLQRRAAELQAAVGERCNPPPGLLNELSLTLIESAATALKDVETVYLSPMHDLHKIPLGALFYNGEPLSIQKKVSIIPTISVLRALQYIDRGNQPVSGPVVFGPDFPDHTRWIANLLQMAVSTTLTGQLFRDPDVSVAESAVLHMVCHGYHDERIPWESGLIFGENSDRETCITGRDLMQWRLQTRLAVLEACDTHRGVVSEMDPIGETTGVAG